LQYILTPSNACFFNALDKGRLPNALVRTYRALPMDSKTTIKLDELAQLVGVSTRWIAKLQRDGIVPAPKNGEYPERETLMRLFAYFRQAGDGAGEALSTERARLTKSKADIAEMQKKQLMGQMIAVDRVVSLTTTIMNGVKERLLTVATKVAARVALTSKPADAESIIRTGIEEALEDLARLPDVATAAAPPRRRS